MLLVLVPEEDGPALVVRAGDPLEVPGPAPGGELQPRGPGQPRPDPGRPAAQPRTPTVVQIQWSSYCVDMWVQSLPGPGRPHPGADDLFGRGGHSSAILLAGHCSVICKGRSIVNASRYWLFVGDNGPITSNLKLNFCQATSLSINLHWQCHCTKPALFRGVRWTVAWSGFWVERTCGEEATMVMRVCQLRRLVSRVQVDSGRSVVVRPGYTRETPWLPSHLNTHRLSGLATNPPHRQPLEYTRT